MFLVSFREQKQSCCFRLRFVSTFQLRWVVPPAVLPQRGPRLLPDARGAPPGSVRRRHGRQQHQVPLQQQPHPGGRRHRLGGVRTLEPRVPERRDLRHRDQDGGVPVGSGRLQPQRRPLLLLRPAAAGAESFTLVAAAAAWNRFDLRFVFVSTVISGWDAPTPSTQRWWIKSSQSCCYSSVLFLALFI